MVVTRRNGLILAAQIAVLCAAIAVAVLTSDGGRLVPDRARRCCSSSSPSAATCSPSRSAASACRARSSRSCWRWRCSARPPPCAIGVVLGADRRRSRRGAPGGRRVNNVATWAVFPLVGALLHRAAALERDAVGAPRRFGSPALVLVVFMVTNFLNFLHGRDAARRSGTDPRSVDSVRSVYLTVLPSEFATGLLTAGVAFSYGRIGVGAVGLAAVVLFVFQYLLRAGVAGVRARRGARASARASWRRCRSACSTPCCRRCRCATR